MALFILFLVGCGKQGIPSTSPLPESTNMLLPPTSTPVPSPTASPIPLLSGSGGGVIAYVSMRNSDWQIYLINADGSGQRRVTVNVRGGYEPNWSQDGTKIIFQYSGLWIADIATGEISRLPLKAGSADLPKPYLVKPSWSPDGKWIAFLNESGTQGDIYLIRSDGIDLRRLTDSSDISRDGNLVWSPDGKQLAYSAHRDGNIEIYVMNADGSNQQRLTNTSVNELFPSLSPDGKKIVYSVVDFFTFNAQIRLMNVDGSGDIILADEGSVNEDAVWADDGQYIVFQSNRDGNYEVYIMQADGSDQRRLTQNSGWDGWPGWGIK